MSLTTWQLLEPSATTPSGKFRNTEVEYKTEWSNIWEITKTYIKTKRKEATPASPIPVETISRDELQHPQPGTRVYRLGHSTVLIRLDNRWLLTDPVFSDRASPVGWMGPKRFHQPPIELSQLPIIDTVIISHDHYDHLDKTSIMALKGKVKQFVTPFGVGQYLRDWGINPQQITELDWWQNTRFGGIEFTATPAQHFSGRGLLDRDSTLWASWVISGQDSRIFFSGDSGYFNGFKTIGEHFGPFDITLIETGAYHPLWQTIHMLPEQSVQAHQDLKGKLMIPIHNSTFDLALHDWFEPLDRVSKAADLAGVNLAIPLIGEAVDPGFNLVRQAWWRHTNEEVIVSDTSNAEYSSHLIEPLIESLPEPAINK